MLMVYSSAGATSITLSFTAFNTELNYDGVIVHDGSNSSATVIGQFTGTSIPSPVSSTGGNMYVEFLSDETVRAAGWSANYTSTICNQPNTPTFSPTIGCGSVTVTANSSNCSGCSYHWNTGANGTTTNFISSSSYTVTASNGSNCSTTASGSVTVNNNPNPPTFSPLGGCSPVTVTANSSNCSGCSYHWNSGSNNATSTFSSTTSYTVTATNNSNCTASASVQ